MPAFRERLRPAVWVFLATALVIPASLLVFLVIQPLVGVVVAIGLYTAIVVLLIAGTPRIEVADGVLRAGRASIPLELVSDATAFEGREAVLERGQRLDARAWLLIRGWIGPVVRIGIDDPGDPTPYWLVSTRRPEELVAAIEAATAEATSRG
ncbi:DUF3093 domain-containing protein [Homoserinibacter sp. YIM 151385]|uniref:DUF3093 domain-containing protein n=1 Tax=Homoserinibacter sp. YIM 151385 TaxID=2985506 RepID=UPI0022F0D048|nr:DUF3093 domain-containing protein [Homoserinibacter sp. YIM 151385]WBU38500.1 DUF3093 domain-containing protein [Homoserinibacter sp. YIM 151385]